MGLLHPGPCRRATPHVLRIFCTQGQMRLAKLKAHVIKW